MIQGMNHENVVCVLRHDDATRREVHHGESLTDRYGDFYRVTGGRPPHKPGSTGRVYVDNCLSDISREFFPGVFNLVWIPKRDAE